MTQASPPGLELLTARSYHARLIKDINQAERRVTLVSLLLLSGPLMDRVFAAIEGALDRGVTVRIVYDAFTWYYVGRGLMPLNPLRSTDLRRERATRQAIDRLSSRGANLHEIGQISRLNPYRGRCHTKFSVVDDQIFSFGGVNLYDEAFHNVDYMMTTHSPFLADHFDALAVAVAEGVRPDQELPIDAHSYVLVDGGQPGHSIIYDRAVELTRSARRIHYISQFCPTGPLAPLLRRAKTTYYFNRPLHAPVHIGLMVAIETAINHLRNRYRRRTFLHAKFILFDQSDGTRSLVAGSHNFSRHGVEYGTQEIALYSTDPVVWQQLHDFMRRHVSRSR